MNDLVLEMLCNLHLDGTRQGPGSDADTRRALALSGLEKGRDLQIADIGCGTGASTLVLADALDANITAIDFVPQFLDKLDALAAERGFDHKISTCIASMDALPFENNTWDAIWSEGAIYNLGFEEGLGYWRQFLKPDGILAVSEITWLTADRPAELSEHWLSEYPGIGTAGEKLSVLENAGFTPLGYFPLQSGAWLDTYYRPLQRRFPAFLARYLHSDLAEELIRAEEHEISLYERYQRHVSYGFYIAKRSD